MNTPFPPDSHLLVVDDDTGHRDMLKALLTRWGFQVTCAEDGLEAVERIREAPYDVVLMDVRMARMDGISALKAIKAYNPAVPVVIMTAYSAVESAVEALKSGAYDYLVKPLDFDALRHALHRTLEHRALQAENEELRRRLPDDDLDWLVGKSQPMRRLKELIRLAAPSEAITLVTGKSGTGKELVARALHGLSPRAHKPLVVVNCAALSEHLLESELFGHEKGAFTGADKRRDGRFMQADGGTLFLDEIGELPLAMQAKLLRAIQQGEIQRVGSDATLTVDVRLVAATNRDLAEEIRLGRFREDLYYRLNVLTLHVPSLEERQDDIPLLAQHFLNNHSARNRKDVKGFTPQAMDLIIHYPWPGNVRELENTIERAVVLLFGQYISERELPAALTRCAAPPAEAVQALEPSPVAPVPERVAATLPTTLEDMERTLILQTLEQTGNNKSEAAKRLGIARKTLHMKLKQYGTDVIDD